MKLPSFGYERPTSIDAAVALLAGHGGAAQAIAGGQSLMPMLAFRLAAPVTLVDLGGLSALRAIDIDAAGIRLGALTRWRDIEDHPDLPTAHPLLRAAVAHVAHYQIRNRGTVGGSLAHADPAAELPGIAIACDATIEVAGPAGQRTIAAAEFFVAPLQTSLHLGEIVTALHLPPWPAERRWAFQEFSRRQGDFALAGVALSYDVAADGVVQRPCLAGIGVAATPIRLHGAEAVLADRIPDEATAVQAGHAAAAECAPFDDVHAAAPYRRALLATLVERAVRQAHERP